MLVVADAVEEGGNRTLKMRQDLRSPLDDHQFRRIAVILRHGFPTTLSRSQDELRASRRRDKRALNLRVWPSGITR